MNRKLLAAVALAAVLPALQGCITAAAVGAGTVALMTEDRRTTGVPAFASSAIRVSISVGAPKLSRFSAADLTAAITAGCACPRIIGPQEPT